MCIMYDYINLIQLYNTYNCNYMYKCIIYTFINTCVYIHIYTYKNVKKHTVITTYLFRKLSFSKQLPSILPTYAPFDYCKTSRMMPL